MKRKVKTCLALMTTLALLMGITACSGDKETPTTDPNSETAQTEEAAPQPTEEVEEVVEEDVRDLGGMEIIIADWWTDNEAEEKPPQNLREEQFREYRDSIFEKHNFTIKQRSISGWGDYQELFTTSVMAGDPAGDIFVMSTGFAAQPLAKGLFYPLSDLESLDFTDSKWNQIMIDAMTIGDKTYAMTTEKFVEPKDFLFFNKRLFAEAGIEPDEPYDLQARGEWTWDKFLEYCEKLTRDTDGDGTDDTYALTGFTAEIMPGFIFSNNAKHIGKDANGHYYNATTEPNYLEALQFCRSIWDKGYYRPYPEGAEWDWFVTAFHDGYAAMIIREAYSTGTWEDMEDDWGMVFVPKGPNAKDNEHYTYFNENLYTMPYNINKEKAEDLAFAFNLYREPLPYDLENPDYWKETSVGYQKFRDTRAVDDTMALLYEGHYDLDISTQIGGLDWGEMLWYNLPEGDATPAELVEAAKPVIDASVNDTNALFN